MPNFTYQIDMRIVGTDEIQRGVWIDRSAKNLKIGDYFHKEDTSSYRVIETLPENVFLVDYAAPEDVPPVPDDTPGDIPDNEPEELIA